ncbi:MAG: hypothetical protein Q7Q71_03355 [Verrucomicrobiota bacterium JB023]|nr:hypothetical protein [Verrucomicrobiota bacterium JB023]
MKIAPFLALLLACSHPVIAKVGEVRTWTSDDGRTLEATLLEVTETGIVVERNRGRVTIPLTRLSAADQEFVAKLKEEMQREEELAALDARRANGFEEGKYAEMVKGEWLIGSDEQGLFHQLYIGKEVKRSSAGPTVPLFVHLHGASARAETTPVGKVEIAPQTLAAEALYRDHPCVIVVPTCPPEPMTWGKDEIQEKLEALIDDLVAHLPIDRDRIYLSGYSMGGRGIGKLIERRPDYYAGALFADGGPSLPWVGRVKTAMWSYYSGERDTAKVPELKEKFASEGVEFRATILPDAKHNGIHWKLAKDPAVWEWLFQQRKK